MISKLKEVEGVAQVVQMPMRDLTLPQAAEYMGIKAKTLSNWIYAGKAPHHYKRFGRRYFKKADLEAFMKNETEVRRAYSLGE